MSELPPEIAILALYPEWPHINYMKLDMLEKLGWLGLDNLVELRPYIEPEAA